MATPVTLVKVDEKQRKAVLTDGAEIEIPAGVTIADKSVENSPKRWHLGGIGAFRVVLSVGDTADNVRFRIRRVASGV